MELEDRSNLPIWFMSSLFTNYIDTLEENNVTILTKMVVIGGN